MEWRIDDAPIDYDAALGVMDARAKDIRAGTAPELAWLLEHPPSIRRAPAPSRPISWPPTASRSIGTGRGGQYTYHGPGQRVGYVMLDLKRRDRADVRAYVRDLEEWIIATLARFNIRGERRPGRIGIWVDRGGGREDKIAAIGVRIRQWVTLHGIAINLDPALEHFSGIVPCGIAGEALGVTSLHQLGILISMPELDSALKASFEEVFGAA